MDDEKMSDVNAASPLASPPLGLFDASRAIQSGTLSGAEYLSQCAARADALEPTLHAFVSRRPLATLLAECSVADGPLAGHPGRFLEERRAAANRRAAGAKGSGAVPAPDQPARRQGFLSGSDRAEDRC